MFDEQNQPSFSHQTQNNNNRDHMDLYPFRHHLLSTLRSVKGNKQELVWDSLYNSTPFHVETL